MLDFLQGLGREDAEGLARHTLGAAGVVVAVTDVMPAGEFNALAGALMTLGSFAWSLAAKEKRERRRQRREDRAARRQGG
ncbi:MAG: hypothetical protein AAF192_16380 [Pseudomonadota bacterium]